MFDETNPNQLASTEDKAATQHDVTTDLLSNSTISVPVKRNILKVIDRLCCAAINIPIGAIERGEDKAWQETKARNRISRQTTDQIVGQIKVDPEYAQKALKKYREKILREQSNLDEIFSIAANLLKKEKSAGSTDKSADSSEEQTINDDWMNNFEDKARSISSEDMQRLFGRILAREIKKPGWSSKKAVNIFGEMDRDDVMLFQQLCSICVSIKSPTAEYALDVRVPSLDGDAGANALKKYDLGFGQLNILHEHGLIIKDYNSWCDYQLCIMNENTPAIASFRHQGRDWALLPSPERKESNEFRLKGVALSRVGRELFPIVNHYPMKGYT